MAEQDRNVAILTEAYRRWADSKGGSVDHWMSICAEDIQFGSLARGVEPVAYFAAYQQRDDLKAYFDGLAQNWEMLDWRVDHLIAQGDRVVMLGHCSWRSKQTGRVATTPKADSWRFVDGKAVEFYEYYDTAHVVQAMTP
jgi:uncharacterized protein